MTFCLFWNMDANAHQLLNSLQITSWWLFVDMISFNIVALHTFLQVPQVKVVCDIFVVFLHATCNGSMSVRNKC